jgi:FtsP/CotA-like multicopper oxidase with cupredoxin domain
MLDVHQAFNMLPGAARLLKVTSLDWCGTPVSVHHRGPHVQVIQAILTAFSADWNFQAVGEGNSAYGAPGTGRRGPGNRR